MTSLADMSLEALVPGLHKALGAFIALIVVNCIILGRAGGVRGEEPRRPLRSWTRSGWGSASRLVLLVMGSVREVLGSGTFLGVPRLRRLASSRG